MTNALKILMFLSLIKLDIVYNPYPVFIRVSRKELVIETTVNCDAEISKNKRIENITNRFCGHTDT